jgi:hypothetical protein
MAYVRLLRLTSQFLVRKSISTRHPSSLRSSSSLTENVATTTGSPSSQGARLLLLDAIQRCDAFGWAVALNKATNLPADFRHSECDLPSGLLGSY